MKDRSILAIIPARSGSKSVVDKNIRLIDGKPMLAYAIQAALDSKVFDEVMVSTDDKESADIAVKYGASVPFMRSEATANDFATTYDVLIEVLSEYKKMGKEFNEICCIYPCVPFLTDKILKQAYTKFRDTNSDRLTPVVKYSFPIQRAFKVNDKGLLEYREPENAPKRSQDLEPMYHDVGMFYFYKTDKLASPNSAMYEMDEKNIQDIDTLDDWKMAELKYKVLHNV